MIRERRFKKRGLSILLALCMVLLGIQPFSPVTAQAAGTGVVDRLNALRTKYEDGKYWNHYVSRTEESAEYYYLHDKWNETFSESVTSTPCAHHSDGYTGSYVGLYDCSFFDGGQQCWGFARKIFYDVFGVKCSSLNKNWDPAKVQVGDYVRFEGASGGHSFVVIERNGDMIKVVECNWGGRPENNCQIRWDRSFNIRNTVAGMTFSYSYHAPNYDEINNSTIQPVGSIMPDNPGYRPISDGDYFIVSALEGNAYYPGSRCLTIGGLPAQNNLNGANAELWQVYGWEGHLFTVTWLENGFYKIKLKASEKQYLDVDGSDQHRGANVQSWEYLGGPAQQWYINEVGDGNGYTLQAKCSGYYLDVIDGKTDDATNIRLFEGNGSLAERWYFIPWGGGSFAEPAIADGEYHIMAQNADGMVMSLEGNGKENGTKIVMEPELGSDTNTFQVRWLGNGYYEIVNSYSGRSLDAEGAASKLGTNIFLYDRDPNFRYNQTWLIRPCNDGSGAFYIISKANGLYIDFDYDNGIAQGKKINLWSGYGGKAQKWKFVPCISAESVSLSADNLTLCVGETAALRAKITPENATNQSLYWSCYNSDGTIDNSIITVENARTDEVIVKVNTAGRAEIFVCTDNLKGATCQVTVQEHSYGTVWKSDGQKHWKECDCGGKSEENTHTFIWKIDKEATEQAAGVKHEECSVCGWKRNENTAIDKLPPATTPIPTQGSSMGNQTPETGSPSQPTPNPILTPNPTLTPSSTLTPNPTLTPSSTSMPNPTLTPSSTLTPSPTSTPTRAPAPTTKPQEPEISSSMKLYYGGDITGKYTAKEYVKVWNKSGYTVEFSSGNREVVRVSKTLGLVTAVGVGTTNIKATFKNKKTGETVVKKCKVTVKRNAVDVKMSANSKKKLLNLNVGDTYQTKVYRTDSDGELVWKGKNIITDGLRFTSSNKSVFTVGRTTGKVTAVGAGEAVLKVWAVQSEGATYNKDGKVVKYKATTKVRRYKVVVKKAK